METSTYVRDYSQPPELYALSARPRPGCLRRGLRLLDRYVSSVIGKGVALCAEIIDRPQKVALPARYGPGTFLPIRHQILELGKT